jgi:hypothetical protein
MDTIEPIVAYLVCVMVALFLMPVDNGMGAGWPPPLGVQFVLRIVNKIKGQK